nr:MAG TPA: hypothetical protein [Bacteriophage sp.]
MLTHRCLALSSVNLHYFLIYCILYYYILQIKNI